MVNSHHVEVLKCSILIEGQTAVAQSKPWAKVKTRPPSEVGHSEIVHEGQAFVTKC